MADIAKFTDPDTGLTDWKAYEAAGVADGSRCERCKVYLAAYITNPPGSPRQCSACREAAEHPERHVRHDNFARCPACKNLFTPEEFPDTREIGSGGEMDVTCPGCDHEFEVSVRVSVEWRSPPALASSPAGEE